MSTEASLVGKLSLVLLCAFVAGCSQQNNDDTHQLSTFLQKDRSPVSGVPYRVYPPDVIGLSSKYVREIDGERRKVRPDGKINLPLVGEVFVAGKTLQEIGYEIAWAARKYYKRVDITVYMIEYNSQKIYVFGQVLRPGPIPWTGSNTILDVLAKVQPTFLACPKKIKVIRGASPRRGGYLNNEKLTAKGANELVIDMTAMVEKGDMSHNIILGPGDVVFVPPNPSAKVGIALRQIFYPVKPVLEAARVPVVIDDAGDAMNGN